MRLNNNCFVIGLYPLSEKKHHLSAVKDGALLIVNRLSQLNIVFILVNKIHPRLELIFPVVIIIIVIVVVKVIIKVVIIVAIKIVVEWVFKRPVQLHR